MDIIIAGAGKVGYNLARTLSPIHNVTVIDRNSQALNRLQENLDILPVNGDIEDPLTYKKLIDKKADLFIAVTDIDEANIISTLIAGDTIDVKKKYIRLRNDFFAKSSIREKLEIDEAIFPLQLSSETIEQLFEYPRANNVKSFAYTDFKLVSIRVTAQIDEIILKPNGYIIVGIERNKRFIIPKDSNSKIFNGDLVYLFGSEDSIKEISPKLDIEAPENIERCVIFGGGDLGIAIARKLLKYGKDVKIVEEDINQCNITDEILGGEAMTLSSKYGTNELFEEEGLAHADMMISATSDDEYNIIKCLEAKERGIKKVMAINNEMEYYNLMHSLGLIVVRGPKMSAYNTIIEKIHSSKVTTERKYCGGQGSVYLRKIFTDSSLIDRRVKPYKATKDTLMYLIRSKKLIPFIEPQRVKEDDILVIFTHNEESQKVESWLNGL